MIERDADAGAGIARTRERERGKQISAAKGSVRNSRVV